MNYALFRKRDKASANPWAGLFFVPPPDCVVEGDEWKVEADQVWVFVGFFDSAKGLAAKLREHPHDEHAVMEGKVRRVTALRTYFLDGKNLDTMDKEWT